jgi:hypothetical protein
MLTLFPDEFVIDIPANRFDCWCTAESVMAIGDKGSDESGYELTDDELFPLP